jgi:hypothetical protein
MKKFLVVLALVAFAATSFAANFTANGSYRIRMFNQFNDGYKDDVKTRKFDQRFRLKFTADNEDGVKGVVYFEIGDSMWGKSGDGADQGADDKVVEVKNAYIEIDKALYLKAGVMGFATPNGIISDDDQAGLILGKKFGDAAVNFVFLRHYDSKAEIDNGTDTIKDEFDTFGLTANFKAAGFKLNPYILYAKAGEDAGANFVSYDQNDNKTTFSAFGASGTLKGDQTADFDGVSAYWLGLNLDGKVADIAITSNLVYGNGKVEFKRSNDVDYKGFVFDVNGGMKVNDIGFNVYGLYGSGADDDDGAMPVLVPTYCLGPKSVRAGCYGLGSPHGMDTAVGQAMAGANVTINSLPALSHTFEAAYLTSTDDDDISDWNLGVIELYNKYQIAKGTKLEFILAYHIVSDDDTDDEENAYLANFRLQFDF